MSGPLLDRIDIQVEVPSLDYKKLTDNSSEESSKEIRERVNRARLVQEERFKDSGIFSNSQMTPRMVKQFSFPNPDGLKLLVKAIKKIGLSARAYDRILKVSRTIADIEGSAEVTVRHISEAIQYRSLDRFVIY